MKYKACCGKRCLLGSCKIRESGGCYCVCRLFDSKGMMESVIAGTTIVDGSAVVTIPDEKCRIKTLEKMSDEKREHNRKYREEIAPKRLEEINARIKEYEL